MKLETLEELLTQWEDTLLSQRNLLQEIDILIEVAIYTRSGILDPDVFDRLEGVYNKGLQRTYYKTLEKEVYIQGTPERQKTQPRRSHIWGKAQANISKALEKANLGQPDKVLENLENKAKLLKTFNSVTTSFNFKEATKIFKELEDLTSSSFSPQDFSFLYFKEYIMNHLEEKDFGLFSRSKRSFDRNFLSQAHLYVTSANLQALSRMLFETPNVDLEAVKTLVQEDWKLEANIGGLSLSFSRGGELTLESQEAYVEASMIIYEDVKIPWYRKLLDSFFKWFQ
jgi:hypothetical protein